MNKIYNNNNKHQEVFWWFFLMIFRLFFVSFSAFEISRDGCIYYISVRNSHVIKT